MTTRRTLDELRRQVNALAPPERNPAPVLFGAEATIAGFVPGVRLRATVDGAERIFDRAPEALEVPVFFDEATGARFTLVGTRRGFVLEGLRGAERIEVLWPPTPEMTDDERRQALREIREELARDALERGEPWPPV